MGRPVRTPAVGLSANVQQMVKRAVRLFLERLPILDERLLLTPGLLIFTAAPLMVVASIS
jgi:hypothetical protein